MKKLLVVLIFVFVVGAAIYYLAPNRQWSVLGFFKPSSKIIATHDGGTATSTGKVLGAATVSGGIRSFIASSGQAASSFVQDTISNAVDGAVRSAKEAVVQQVAAVLGVSTSSTAPTAPAPSANGGSQTTVIVSNTTVAGGFEVCSAHKVGETVSYLLEFPSSSAATTYTVDWGDGMTTRNDSASGARSALAAHSYDKAGSYSVSFKLSGGAAIVAQKEVCIQ